MIRETVIVLGILVLLQPSDAIRCYECSSLISPSCSDGFSNSSTRSIDCAQQQVYDITPIEYCRKIKYKDGDRWVYLRGCNIKDNLQIKNAQYHFCNTNLCNSADSHRPAAMLVMLLFTSFLFIKLLRL
ncbi:uncharacterized protein LOC129575153 [Sitodiplosis mosellana]|uniref:uncharacterized protein LOC129575153 n=1 Tax=Sitodiplosis mosellana TaxID=263140 RepID=UPI002443CB1D|nr:uncharacterized protein LOC129575153 [Sitodiplosis mosellana]